MRLPGHRNKHFIISILLLMIFAQSFSMHFHFAEGDAEHAHQAHTHSLDSLHDDHVTTDHDDEAGADLIGAFTQKSQAFDLFVFILLSFLFVFPLQFHFWRDNRSHHPPPYLLFFRPPLRAPPC